MFFRRLIPVLVIGFLGFAALRGAGEHAYQMGWMQGYTAGQQAASQPANSAPAYGYGGPATPYGMGGPYGMNHNEMMGRGWGGSPFGFVGGVVKFLVLLFVISFVMRRIFWRRAWHKHHGGSDGRWEHGGPWGEGAPWTHHGKGHRPPWFGQGMEPTDEPVMKA